MNFFNIQTQEGLQFVDQIDEIIANDKNSLIDKLQSIETYLNKGFYLAGFVSYEAGYYLENKDMHTRHSTDLPLIYFKVFKSIKQINEIFPTKDNVCIYDIKYSENQDKYSKKIDKVKEYIKNGYTYEINYTMKIDFKLQGSPESLYYKLSQRQNAEFSAFLDFEKYLIISLSPELFIKREGNILTSKPMKGTTKRATNLAENLVIIQQMKLDSKILSENATIVDLIRNDMSIIAKNNTLKVINPFEVQTFNTINQMISTIKCEIEPDTTVFEIFKALFPCGSITGAPKIRTMQIIETLEDSARGVYCGAVGYIMPNKNFSFNVGIRTVLYDKVGKKAKMGIGGGIIYESKVDDEFNECILKSQFLRSINDNFEIFETMHVKKGKIIFLDSHLHRLIKTADYFGFNYNMAEILDKINSKILSTSFAEAKDSYKIKLLLKQDGNISLIANQIDKPISNKICLSKIIMDSADIFLKHKTTNRKIYNSEYEKYKKLGFYDVIFVNQNGYISEGSRHNIFIKNQHNQLITPPIIDGILPGIMREKIIKEQNTIEQHLTFEDIQNAKEILLSNAVHSLVRVEL